jgi:hypothetical protein
MPDICFHFSSETADASGHCPGGDRTRITMPIEPALQIPNTAKPVCWLHNLAFNNAMANVAASDGTNKLVVATGDGALVFQKGTQTANAPFIGFKYKATDSDGTEHDMAMVAPLTQEHGLHGATYGVDSAPTSDGGTANLNWTGIPATLDAMSIPQVYSEINACFERALNSGTYAKHTRQDMIFATENTAAYAHGTPSDAWYRAILALMPLPGSTASGLLTYNSATPSGIGTSVTISASPNDNAALITALNAHEFQLMTSQEINDWINDVWVTTLTTYSGAVSIFEALGGAPLTPSASDPIWSDRNRFAGDATVQTPGSGTFGMYLDSSSSDVELSLPIAAYELSGFEKAIARQAKANTTFWTTANSHQAASTQLADPDIDAQWTAATSGTAGSDGITYIKPVALTGNAEINRCVLQCAPQVKIPSGNLLTTVLGFDSSQLGSGTEGPATVSANNAARVDRNRCVVFHAPTLAAGSYSTAGKRGGSALAMIPITAGVGDVQAWEASVPVQVPANIAGSSLSHLTVFLSNEDGEKLNLLADRWSAQLILSF